jgi:NADH:ubiquinone oxidoreductase subunit K
MAIGLAHYLVLGALLFCGGVFVMTTKRNAIGVLIGVELVLNAANVNLVAFSRYGSPAAADGQVLALFVIVLAAAEAALAVAICVNFYRRLQTIDVDHGDKLRG